MTYKEFENTRALREKSAHKSDKINGNDCISCAGLVWFGCCRSKNNRNLSLNSRKMFSSVERGSPKSSNYRLYFKNNEGEVISPFHDIPLMSSPDSGSTYYNMIVEVPRWTNAKMEIATKELMNPIKQDTKNGKLRFVHNCFPYHGYVWNYGALPQTWEDPSYEDPNTKSKGDNDPIDVCEIGSKTLARGDVVPVKILGVLGLIDVGETDWKLIVIKADDPLAEKLNDISDIESYMPSVLKATREWFEIYKIPDGKPANKFAFNGQFKGAEFARQLIQETHEQWRRLVHTSKSGHPLSLENSTQDKSPFKISSEAAQNALKAQPESIKSEVLTAEEDQLTNVSYVMTM